MPLLLRQYAQKFAKNVYYHYTMKTEKIPEPKAFVTKVTGMMKINLHRLLQILTDAKLRSEWDLDVYQSYSGERSDPKQKYLLVEYLKSSNKFDEVTTFEYFSDDDKDYVVETIKLGDYNYTITRVWQIV